MQLIGLLDSPYVRRVAVSLQLMGLPFEHRPISVFTGWDAFRAINPVVKAPSLVCEDGQVLMDSSLILAYAEAMPGKRRSLWPSDLAARRRCLRLTGLALAVMEKAVQTVMEHNIRPAEKRHAPWLERVDAQLQQALSAIERELQQAPLAVQAESIDDAGISTAVAWHFVQRKLPEQAPAKNFPALQRHAEQAEQLAAFVAAPFAGVLATPTST